MGCNCGKKKRLQQASVTSPTPKPATVQSGRGVWYPEPDSTKTTEPASR